MPPPYAIIDRGRGPELAGTRITVFDVIHYLKAGCSPNYIATVLGLSTAQVLALIQYIEDHKEEVMAENRKIEERIARGNPPEIEERLKNSSLSQMIRKKWEERKQQLAREEANGESDPG